MNAPNADGEVLDMTEDEKNADALDSLITQNEIIADMAGDWTEGTQQLMHADGLGSRQS